MSFRIANPLLRSSRQSIPRQHFAAVLQTQSLRQPSARPFSTSVPLLKKRKIAAASNSPKHNEAAAESTHDDAASSKDDVDDPLDMSAVTSAYAPIDQHFKMQLSNMVHGGRFNPTNLGNLSVPIKDEDGPTNYPLRELAQIVPRSGRSISLLVNEKEYIKPIMSAVQSSKEFNQQPQRSEDNELELLLTVERERKDEVIKRVKETTQAWREGVRRARSKHEKKLQGWKKKGTVLPDLVKRAEKELQKVQDKKMKEIDQEEAQTIKQL